MCKYFFSLLIIIFCGTTCSAKFVHATDSIRWNSMDRIRQLNVWLGSVNPAGLHVFDGSSLSVARVCTHFGKGDFINYNQSDNAQTYLLQAESYYRISSRLVMAGQVEYSYFKGKHMGGSYFMNPYQAPFDLIEYTNDNRGDKKLEKYFLEGAFSYDLSSKWVMGGHMKYTSANYTKGKDLRHINHLMDLLVSPGIVFQPNSHWKWGVNYEYERRNETTIQDIIGTTDKYYKTIVSYCAFWGSVEQFGENGYTKQNEEKPLLDKYHNANVQIAWKPTDAFEWFNEFGYRKRKGSYGVDSPGSVMYSEHHSDIFSFKTRLSCLGNGSAHFIDADFEQEKLSNDENIYRYESDESGKRWIEYFGSLEVGHRKVQLMNVAYTAFLGQDPEVPVWILKAGAHLYHRDITATVYPYCRTQKLSSRTFNLAGERHFYKEKERYHFLLGCSYTQGSDGTPKDGLLATPGDSKVVPQSQDVFLKMERDFLTCKQINTSFGINYAHVLGHNRLSLFADLRYDWVHAFHVTEVIGNNHHAIRLALGCAF